MNANEIWLLASIFPFLVKPLLSEPDKLVCDIAHI